jgi:hypothetical protein
VAVELSGGGLRTRRLLLGKTPIRDHRELGLFIMIERLQGGDIEMFRQFIFGLFATSAMCLHFQTASASAGQIRYSWSGRIVPSESEDPWQIGEQGREFALEFAVSSNARDDFDINVEFAAFDVAEARLLLDGEEIEFTGPGTRFYG